jgi:hypothetical protein
MGKTALRWGVQIENNVLGQFGLVFPDSRNILETLVL